MKKEKAIALIVMVVLAPFLVWAGDWSTCSPYQQGIEPPRPIVIYPTIPGTYVPDYSSRRLIIKRSPFSDHWTVYQNIPGTNLPDYSAPRGYVQQRPDWGTGWGDNYGSWGGWQRIKVYPTLSGTSVRDFSKPEGWAIELNR